MGFSLSPSVTVREFDLTLTIPGVATSIGAYVGDFQWGPVMEITLVDSEKKLTSRYGLPNDNNFADWFPISNFLGYSNHVKTVRVVGDTAVNSIGQSLIPVDGTTITEDTIVASPIAIHNLNMFEQIATFEPNVPFYGKYPGTEGNNIKVYAINGAYCSDVVADVGVVTTSLTLANPTTTTGTMEADAGTTFTNLISGDTITLSGSTTGANDGTYTVISVTSDLIVTVSGNFDTPEVDTAPPTLAAVNTGSAKWSEFAQKDEFDYAPEGDEIWILVEVDGYIVERYLGSQDITSFAGTGGTNYFVEMINRTSKYLWAPVAADEVGLSHQNDGVTNSELYNGTLSVGFTVTPVNYVQTLSLGTQVAPSTGDYMQGWDMFLDDEVVDVNLLMQGGAGTEIGQYILHNIAMVRKDCVVFMSPNQSDVVGSLNPALDLVKLRDVGAHFATSSSYGVIDGNYKYQYDKYNDVYRWIALNGDIAGTCARTDDERDPWWSPAGYNRGHIKNAVKLAFYPSRAQRDELYKHGINPVTSFKGEGTILFGDKTAQTKPSAFDRINVRRLFIVLEKAISTAAKYKLFEFNDAITRSSFVNMVEPFLRDVKGRRGIYDFLVVCDETNNTGEIIDRNEFVADIYIKPARAINYIYLNFVAVKTGVAFEEVLLTNENFNT